MKAYIKTGHPEDQLWLLPPSIDDFVAEDAPVRAFAEVVDKLDLGFLHNRDGRETERGRPSYDPTAMVKVILYGMTLGIRSSRKLAQLLNYDLRFIFLAHMAKPDFRTIARFRKEHGDHIVKLFVSTVELAKKMGLVTLEDVAVDDTKIDANAAKHKYRSKEELDGWLDRTKKQAETILANWENNDKNDDAKDETDTKAELPAALRTLEARQKLLEKNKLELDRRKAEDGAKDDAGIVVTDNDSRMMKTKSGIRPAYNAQAVADGKAQVVIAAEVCQDAADNKQFEAMMDAAKSNVGSHPGRTLADGGNWSKETLEYIEAQKIDAYVAASGITPAQLGEFAYDKENDVYRSADGEMHVFERNKQTKDKSGERVVYKIYRGIKTGKRKWARCDIANYTTMQLKTTTAEGKAIYRKRAGIIEPVFGHIKGPLDLRKLTMRGLKGARTEFLIACIAHNIGKMVKSLSIEPNKAAQVA